jgi:hypothetical protein
MMTRRKRKTQRLPLLSRLFLTKLPLALPPSHNPQRAIHFRSSRLDEAQKRSRRAWQTLIPVTILCLAPRVVRRAVRRRRRRMPRRRTVMTIGSRDLGDRGNCFRRPIRDRGSRIKDQGPRTKDQGPRIKGKQTFLLYRYNVRV